MYLLSLLVPSRCESPVSLLVLSSPVSSVSLEIPPYLPLPPSLPNSASSSDPPPLILSQLHPDALIHLESTSL